MPRLAKRFAHKIYSNTGTYLGTLSPSLVTNMPAFNWKVNGGMGEMVIKLALSLKDFSANYENGLIKLGNEVRTIVTDSGGQGVRIFDGFVTAYDPTMTDKGHQEVVVHVTSSTKTLYDMMFKDGSATTKAYSSYDPSDIARDMLSKYGGIIFATAGSITSSATVVTYTFDYLSYGDALDIVLTLCPAYWYWCIDAYNIFYLKLTDFNTIDHKLYIGKQIKDIQATKSIENLYNAIYFKGGGDPAMYKYYDRTSSIAEYGRREYKMQDERVTVAATALIMATKFLDENDHPLSLLTATVIDNGVDAANGYDIESFRPGQVVQIQHPSIESKVSLWDMATWDVDFWDYDIRYSLSLPMQLIEVDYQFSLAVLKLSLSPADVAQRIEDIERNLDTTRSVTVPSTPS